MDSNQVQKDTDKIIEAQQSAHYFFVSFHDDVDPGAYAFVHQLWERKTQQNVSTSSVSTSVPRVHPQITWLYRRVPDIHIVLH